MPFGLEIPVYHSTCSHGIVRHFGSIKASKKHRELHLPNVSKRSARTGNWVFPAMLASLVMTFCGLAFFTAWQHDQFQEAPRKKNTKKVVPSGGWGCLDIPKKLGSMLRIDDQWVISPTYKWGILGL